MLDFYELLKAAKTGLLPPDATYYDRCKAQALRRSMLRKRAERQERQPEPEQIEGSPETGQPLKGVVKRDTLISNDIWSNETEPH